MAEELLARSVLAMDVDGSEAVAAMDQLEAKVAKSERDIATKAGRMAEELAGIGKGASASAAAMDAGSKRFIASLEQEANRLSLSRAEYKRWQAESRGIAKEVYEPLIAKIEQATRAQAGLTREVEAARPAFEGLKGLVGGMAAALVAGFSVNAFSGMIKHAIDAGEALNDLSIKSGLTVERLSALAKLGLTTSTSAEAITQATNRLAKGMAVANEESAGTAQAIKALGLDFDRFKALKPDDQLVTLAKAMGEFEDGSSKSAVAMTLLGKSGADLLPFLKDLADANELVATTTAEQAAMADRFNDGMTVAGERVTELQRSFALGLLPTLIEMLDTTTALADVFGNRLAADLQRADERAAGMSVSARALGTVLETLMSLGADVSFVFQGIGRDLGGMAAQMVKLATLDFAGFAAIRESLVNDAETARAELDAYQARLVGTTARMADAARIVAQYGISNEEAAGEVARLAGRMGEATKKTLEFSAAKEKATQKSTADPFAAEREAAKSWAKVMEEAAKIEEDATGKTLGLSKAQQALLGYLSSPAYAANSEQMRQMAVAALIAAHNTEQLGESQRRTAALLSDANANYSKMLAEFARGTASVIDQIAAMENQARAAQIAAEQNISLAEAIELVTIARLRERQAALDIPDSGAYDAIQREIEARERLLGLIRSKAAKDANAEAARQHADAWQRMADDAGTALTNALMQGGRSAGDQLKAYFKTLILQPLIRAIVDPVTGAIAAFAVGGGGTSGGGTGGTAAATAGLNNASTLYNLYQAGTGYSSGVNALAGYLGAGTTAGASSVSLAYANAVGAAGGDSLGAFIAANNSWTGVAAGNSLGAAAAGEGVAAGSGAAAGETASSAGASAGTSAWTLYAAAFIAAWMGSKSAWEKGYNNENLNGAFRYSPESTFTDLLKIGGMSDKSANIWGGGAVYTSIFGRADPRVTEQGVRGTIGGGGFTGEAYADILAKGGWLRKDKRWTDTQAVPESIDMFFDDAAAAILKKAGEYGKVLGLPAEQLGSVTAQIRVAIGDDVEKNKTAITEALGKYGDALVASFEPMLKPVMLYGETVTQTIERIGSALINANDLLQQLGFDQIEKSVAGGKAAVALAGQFGGADNLRQVASQFYQAFYSEAERTEALTTKLRTAFSDLGLTMPDLTKGADAARAAYRAQVEAAASGDKLLSESGRNTFAALLGLSGIFDEVATSADKVAQAAEEAAKKLADALGSALTEAITRFGTPQERQASTFGGIAANLQRDAGVSVSIGQLIGASIADIEAFARSFISVSTNSDAAKTAVLGAANALFDLKKEATDQRGSLELELLRAQGKELDAVNIERGAEIAQLAALEASLGVAAGTFTDLQKGIYAANDAAAALAKQQNLLAGLDSVVGDFLSPQELANYRAERIQQTLAGGGINVGIDGILNSTRQDIRQLWDAVGLEGKQAILDAYTTWETLYEEQTRSQRDALTKQIDGLKQLRGMADDFARFTKGLAFSDLSPLSAKDQLDAAQSLFESTLAKARSGDTSAAGQLTSIARDYLDEAAGAFASGPAYSAIFQSVTGAIDQFGGFAAALDPQIEALEAQLTSLDSIGAALGANGAIYGVLSDIKTAVIEDPRTTGTAPKDRTYIDGPAGSSGGLSGAPKGEQYIEVQRSWSAQGGDRQAELLQQQVNQLAAAVAELKTLSSVASANAAVDQQGFNKTTEAVERVAQGVERIAGTARQAQNKSAVMPR